MNLDHQRFCQIRPVHVLLLGLALALGFGEAMAALGQAPLEVVPSRSAAAPPFAPTSAVPAAKLQSAVRPGAYSVHESVLDTGTTVTEFATPAGIVFAVSWRGPVLPDLDALLGTYFAAFRAEAQQARAAGRRGSPMVVATDTLVVNSAGRMRNFAGWAYAPWLVPAEVAIKDVLQ